MMTPSYNSPHSSRRGNSFGKSVSGIYGPGRFTSKLRKEEKEIISVAFDTFKDETDHITTDTLKAAFANTEGTEQASLQDLLELIDGIDENGDGKLDQDEFTSIMTKKFLGEDDDASFVHALEMLDSNKDGFIPVTELRHTLMTEGENPMSEQEVDEFLMFADLEGDGLVGYKQLLKWLSKPDNLHGGTPRAA